MCERHVGYHVKYNQNSKAPLKIVGPALNGLKPISKECLVLLGSSSNRLFHI